MEGATDKIAPIECSCVDVFNIGREVAVSLA